MLEEKLQLNFAILLSSGLVAVGGATLLARKQTTPAITIAPAIAENAISTYISTLYNFSFHYPAKYEMNEKDVKEGRDTFHTITFVTSLDRQLLALQKGENDVAAPTMTINVFPGAAKNLTLTEWVKTNSHSGFNLSKNKNLGTTTFMGVPAVAYTSDGLLASNNVVFSHKGNIIMASMNYITNQDVIWKDFATLLQSFILR